MSTTNSVDEKPGKTDGQIDYDGDVEFNPRSLKFLTVMIGMYMSIFLVALDRTIVAIAVPALTNTFESISDIGWYGSAYLLTGACCNPIFGRIYQLYSTKWVFLAAITIFEIGSVVCGAAPSSVAFVIGRAVAGIGSAGIFQGGMMVIVGLVPLSKRPMYTAVFGMSFGVCAVLGPIVGGAFVDHVSWRWCFYINLPVGAVTMAILFFFFHMDSPSRENLSVMQQIQRLDPIGIFFLVPSIICLVLALQWGGTTYSWSSPTVIGLLVTFFILLIIFGVVETLTPETAMAPPHVVLNRNVAGSMIFTFLNYGSVMAIAYYLAIWFQIAKSLSAMHAGINTIPMVIAMVVASVISAKITQRIGYYIPAIIVCTVLSSIGAGLLSTMTRFSDHSYWIGYQVLFGMGLGCGGQQASLAMQKALPRKDVSLGLALGFLMQQLGGAVFLSVCQNVFATKLVNRLSGVAGLDPMQIVSSGATAIRTIVPADEVDVVVDAYSFGITRCFLIGAALSAATILGVALMEWKSIKDDKKDKVAGTTKV
ncbi:major facilitator superfamily transporter [Boeremia exigua]|uniref:major facilitator superfamily transporter n=1 Tax=Boeremia exigua TaxID=749465 RepID=UPI001E8E0B45|nr:major facilitator superfamily transporter [Boeremia exigua]KAH6622456.1 major facilitator superfamily transporter [Boeremia exigua]